MRASSPRRRLKAGWLRLSVDLGDAREIFANLGLIALYDQPIERCFAFISHTGKPRRICFVMSTGQKHTVYISEAGHMTFRGSLLGRSADA